MTTAKQAVLVADDYPATLRLLSRALELEGYRVVTAHDAATVLKLISEEKSLALVVLGIDEVKQPSTEICRRLREFSDLPVIILSARNKESDIARGLDAGADEYIRKPFNINEFVAQVKAVLRRHNLSLRLRESQQSAG